MGIDIRPFDKRDSTGVKELILSILTKEYPFDKGAYSDSDLDRIEEVYGGRNEAFFVIEDGGKIVGTVGVKEDAPGDALLRRLFVDPSSRKKGYGTALISKALKFCADKGYRKISFRCTDRMQSAMKLCIKHGFAEKEALQVGGFHIHRLEKKLLK